ncbi:ParB/RepB/Spo0J family partition protein [Streptomyces lydicus]|uniref:ParB/RepB/Spo0J family partition protein n=1 Tax=Streptomyces lydicus TaxID=47763 RepID=UPI0036EFACBC
MATTQSTELHRTSVHVDQLVPNGARADLALDAEMINSVRANGVRVVMAVRPLSPEEQADIEAQRAREQEKGSNSPAPSHRPLYKILMGDRRHGAAKAAGQTMVPVVVVADSARAKGEDYIEALVENDERFRRPLSNVDQALALFQAHDSGIEVQQLAQLTVRDEEEVQQAVAAGGRLGAGTRGKLTQQCQRQVSMDELLAFAEFEGDEEAIDRLLRAHRMMNFRAVVYQEREKRARAVQRQEIEKAGIRLVENPADLPKGAALIEDLYDEAELQLDPDDHEKCPGHAVIWDEGSDRSDAVVSVCLDPEGNGHHRESSVPDDGADAGGDGTPPLARPVLEEPTGLPHAVVVAGNRVWRAATKQRQDWLKEFCAGKTAPKELRSWVSTQWLACPKPVAQWTGDDGRAKLVAEILGRTSQQVQAPERGGWLGPKPSASRLTLCDFAVIAGCFEKRIEVVQTWRTDEPVWDLPAIRRDARAYLKALVSFGYEPTPVERAVIEDEEFDPDVDVDNATETADDA